MGMKFCAAASIAERIAGDREAPPSRLGKPAALITGTRRSTF
jgi:hypothetical protein